MRESLHALRKTPFERRQTLAQAPSQDCIERQNVGRALPDRQDLRITQQHRQARVLDVTRAAEGLDGLAHDRYGLPGCRKFGYRGQKP